MQIQEVKQKENIIEEETKNMESGLFRSKKKINEARTKQKQREEV